MPAKKPGRLSRFSRAELAEHTFYVEGDASTGKVHVLVVGRERTASFCLPGAEAEALAALLASAAGRLRKGPTT